ncbi:hypothetical protein IJG72_06335 [bacterium]|nr:hypothetical protein [bacterium]
MKVQKINNALFVQGKSNYVIVKNAHHKYFCLELTKTNNDKWITVKPHGEEEKGRHLKLEGDETPKEAMKRQWGVDVDKKKQLQPEKRSEKSVTTEKSESRISDIIKNDKNLRKIEKEIMTLEHEEGIIFDKDGNVLEKIGGEKHRVIVNEEILRKMNNKIFTHNHPSGNVFSSDDLFSGFAKASLRELRAVTPDGTVYSLKPMEGSNIKKLLPEFEQTEKKALRTFKESVDRKFKFGMIDLEERKKILYEDCNKYVNDKLVKMFREKSKDFGFEFKEYKQND